MALVNCPEVDCDQQVSDSANECPKCGAPVSDKAAITTQGTSKSFKKHILYSRAIFFLGIIWLAYEFVVNEKISFIPMPFIIVGFLWYTITKSKIWWNHG